MAPIEKWEPCNYRWENFFRSAGEGANLFSYVIGDCLIILVTSNCADLCFGRWIWVRGCGSNIFIKYVVDQLTFSDSSKTFWNIYLWNGSIIELGLMQDTRQKRSEGKKIQPQRFTCEDTLYLDIFYSKIKTENSFTRIYCLYWVSSPHLYFFSNLLINRNTLES